MIRVKFFGVMKDATGRSHIELDPDGISSIETLERRLHQMHPDLVRYKDFMIFLKDLTVVSAGAGVKDGDEITVMIPTAGG